MIGVRVLRSGRGQRGFGVAELGGCSGLVVGEGNGGVLRGAERVGGVVGRLEDVQVAEAVG